MNKILIAAFLALLASSPPALASCGDRPGTPDEPRVELNTKDGSVFFSWRATHGRSEPELIMFYDVHVVEQATGNATRVLTGVPPFGAAVVEHLESEGGVPVAGFPRYGERTGVLLQGLPFKVPQCFTVRTRTQQGTEGCVSQIASAPVCATPTKIRRLGRRQ